MVSESRCSETGLAPRWEGARTDWKRKEGCRWGAWEPVIGLRQRDRKRVGEIESGVPLARPRQWTGGDRQGGTKGHLKILRLGDRTDDGSWEETVKETSFLL